MGYGIGGTSTHDFTVYVMDIATYEVLRSGDITAGAYTMYVGESSDIVDVIGRTTASGQNIISYKNVALAAGIDPDFQAFIMGGNNGSPIDTTRKFYIAWSTGAVIPVASQDGGAGTMLQKAHLTTGGAVNHNSYVTDTWSSETNYGSSDSGQCSHVINNEFYVGGGYSYTMRYDKYTTGDVWVNYSMPDLDQANQYDPTRTVGTASTGSVAYFIAGIRYNGSQDGSCAKDIGNGTHSAITGTRLSYFTTCVYLNSDIHNFGQMTTSYGTYHDIYSISGNSWSSGAQMPTTLVASHEAAFVLDGKGHVAGGINPSIQSVHHAYTPVADTWAADVTVPEAVGYHRSTLI